MKLFLTLFFEFFKTGLFSIGGGLATLPFLNAMGEKYGWFTSQDVANMLAVSESTPGPIGVNMATYVGVQMTGVLGGIITTLGLIAPSFIIMVLVASVLKHFRENRFVQSSLRCLRPVSVGLVASAVLRHHLHRCCGDLCCAAVCAHQVEEAASHRSGAHRCGGRYPAEAVKAERHDDSWN